MFVLLGSSPYQNNQSSFGLSEQDSPWFNFWDTNGGACLQEHRILFSRAVENDTKTGSSNGLSKEQGFPVYLHHFSPLISACKQKCFVKKFYMFCFEEDQIHKYSTIKLSIIFMSSLRPHLLYSAWHVAIFQQFTAVYGVCYTHKRSIEDINIALWSPFTS